MGKGFGSWPKSLGINARQSGIYWAGRSRDTGEREVANPVMDRVAGVLHKWREEDLENPKKQRHTARPPGIIRSAESAGARREDRPDTGDGHPALFPVAFFK